MSGNKERWLQCYEQAEEELGSSAAVSVLREQRADELFEEREATAIDEAYDRYRDDRLFRLKCDEPTT